MEVAQIKRYSNYHIHWIRARELYLENKQEFATTKKLHKQNLLLTMKIEVDQSGIRVCFIWHLIGLSFVLRNARGCKKTKNLAQKEKKVAKEVAHGKKWLLLTRGWGGSCSTWQVIVQNFI